MLSQFQSQKFRFWSFISMVLLVFVHGYNLKQGYLQPWTMPGEPLTLTSFIEYWVANGVLRFRIPMLFIISGYLFAMNDYRPYKQRMGKRVRTLLYPYLVWSAAGLLFTYILEFFYIGKEVVAATQMMQLDENRVLLHQYHWYEVFARWIFFPASYQLWFIRVLLVYNLAYPGLRWCVLHQIVRWIFFPVAIFLWVATAGIGLAEGEGLLFFSLGILIQKSNFDIAHSSRWQAPRYWAIIFILTSVSKTILAFGDAFNGIEIVLSLLHKLTVFSGLLFAWYGCDGFVRYLGNKKWFEKISAFSFMIYAAHAPLVVYITKAVFLYLPHYQGYRMATFLVVPLCIILLIIGLSAVFRKWVPSVYSFVTGGRGLV